MADNARGTIEMIRGLIVVVIPIVFGLVLWAIVFALLRWMVPSAERGLHAFLSFIPSVFATALFGSFVEKRTP